jgi:hypothetical protein
MTPLAALAYSFLFGLLHGIVPDEHTWPITLSYAIGGASGRAGMKAGLYFSVAFTLQRMIVSELAYLALVPFLLSSTVNRIVYIVVGVAMSVAGAIVLRQKRYPHFHLLGRCRRQTHEGEHEATKAARVRQQAGSTGSAMAPPARWTLIHGFIAGFGFGGFSLFINTVAAPAMSSPWLGFLPGLVYGLGTMVVLVTIGALFGASLRWTHALTEQELKQLGSRVGGRTLFLGGLLFTAFGIADFLGVDRLLPVDPGYALIGLFMIVVAIPALAYSLREVLTARDQPDSGSEASQHTSTLPTKHHV